MKKDRLVLVGLLGVLGVVAGACRRDTTSLPLAPLVAQVAGTVEIAGVSAPVRVVRDHGGVAHIFAESQNDLFFAQGFVQAQDRLFQMDLWRRAAQGRLAEVLGPNFAGRDTMTRRVRYRGDVDAEWASYGPDARAIAAAFVRGINAWVTLARERPPEAFALAGWKPEAWSALDLLNRTDAFVASGDAIDEIFRARLVAALGADRVGALLPRDRPMTIPAGLDVTAISSLVADVVRRAGTPPFFVALPSTVRSASTGPVPWAPRTLEHPSRRYLVHLSAPGWNVIGATAPWRPGVAIGHNDRIAWKPTAFDADTQDIYVEKLNPSNPHQVEYDGRWIDTTVVTDTILVKGRAEPFVFDCEFTRHGVIVASDSGRHLAYAVAWSGFEPGAAAELGALAVDRARSAVEFRAALTRWKMPSSTFEYVDAGGTRGIQTAALVPVRRNGAGVLPTPGWMGANDWIGWRTPDDLRPTAKPAHDVSRLSRANPDRAEDLLRNLVSGSLKAQRMLIAEATDDAARTPPATPVVFAYPLGVTARARERFNIGPLGPARDGGNPFALTFSPADWDRTRAMNAPGQSESPDSPHFSDLAQLWAVGQSIALPFSDRAVEAGTETTLMLTPRAANR